MNIIVTGASRGIGYETVLQLLKEPDNHVFAIARSDEKLNSLKANSISQKLPGQLTTITFDLDHGNYDDFDSIINEHKEFDVIINNAGAIVNKPFFEISNDDWIKMFRVNLLAPVKLIKKIAPKMGKNSKAHIVNISSMGGFQGSSKFPGLAAYSASKAALSNLTEVLAEELKELNIAVNCLAIGAVQTEMLEEAFPGYQAPLQPNEMADFISHFALTAHKYMNGKIIPVALSTP